MSGVGMVILSVGYAAALLLEFSRLWFRSAVRSGVPLGFAIAGWLGHTASLCLRAVQASAGGASPLSSEQDWYLVAAWALVAVYLFLATISRKASFGLFLLPLALVLVGIAAIWANPQPLPSESAWKVWGAIHGLSIMFAAVSVLIGFTAGSMYFVQARQLKQKRLPSHGLRLPSLEWLQKANGRAIVIAGFMLLVGVGSGMILNRIDVQTPMGKLPWYDPVVLSTLLLLTWLLLAAVINLVYRPAQRGRKMAYLTLLSFVLLAVMLIAGLLLNSRHWDRGAGNGKSAVGYAPSDRSARFLGALNPECATACPCGLANRPTASSASSTGILGQAVAHLNMPGSFATPSSGRSAVPWRSSAIVCPPSPSRASQGGSAC
jgi:ABC-type uncharacterized transport system permease subunit